MNRRGLLVGLTAGLAAETSGLLTFASASPAAQSNPSLIMPRLLFRDDSQFWFETLRVIGAADFGGSQFGEAVAAAGPIKSGDYDSWYEGWNAVADRVASEAEKSRSSGRKTSARDGFLRASNYYRSSEFFLHANPSDPRVKRAYERSVACFRLAAEMFPSPIEGVEIPYEGTTLPGYLYRAPKTSTPQPLVVMHNGFDGSVEEMHFLGAQAAAERGYNVLSFDGPGQFGPLHRENLTFRPDWERVVSSVLDFAIDRIQNFDKSRIALMGVSMGGLLAPRAAAFEKRIAACIANDGIYDYSAPQLATIPPGYRDEFKRRLRAERDDEIDGMLSKIVASSPTARWAFTHGMYAMGVTTPRAYMAASLGYTLAGGVAERINCPTLVCDAEGDEFFAGQPQILFDHLTCRKTLLRFTAAEGAGAHCQVDGSRLAFSRIYDWLDEILVR